MGLRIMTQQKTTEGPEPLGQSHTFECMVTCMVKCIFKCMLKCMLKCME